MIVSIGVAVAIFVVATMLAFPVAAVWPASSVYIHHMSGVYVGLAWFMAQFVIWRGGLRLRGRLAAWAKAIAVTFPLWILGHTLSIRLLEVDPQLAETVRGSTNAILNIAGSVIAYQGFTNARNCESESADLSTRRYIFSGTW